MTTTAQAVTALGNNPPILLIAFLGFCAPTVATVVGNVLQGRANRNAQKAATDAARQLVVTAASSRSQLDDVKKVADATQKVTDATHAIINNQHTVLLQERAHDRRIIAKLLPDDADAQEAAETAEREAWDARNAQDKGIGKLPS